MAMGLTRFDVSLSSLLMMESMLKLLDLEAMGLGGELATMGRWNGELVLRCGEFEPPSPSLLPALPLESVLKR